MVVMILNSILILSAAWAEIPYLESVEDGESLEIVKDGSSSALEVGEDVRPNSLTKIPGIKAARFVYKDGSSISVGGDSEIEFSSEDGIPVLNLIKGFVFGKIEPAANKDRHKFLIKTRVAVVGIRGTEFGIDATADGTQIHTLSGRLEVAKERSGLGSERVALLGPEQMIEANDSGLGPSRPFRRAEFLEILGRRHGRLRRMLERPIVRRERVRKKLKEIPAELWNESKKDRTQQRREAIQERRREQRERRRERN